MILYVLPLQHNMFLLVHFHHVLSEILVFPFLPEVHKMLHPATYVLCNVHTLLLLEYNNRGEIRL